MLQSQIASIEPSISVWSMLTSFSHLCRLNREETWLLDAFKTSTVSTSIGQGKLIELQLLFSKCTGQSWSRHLLFIYLFIFVFYAIAKLVITNIVWTIAASLYKL